LAVIKKEAKGFMKNKSYMYLLILSQIILMIACQSGTHYKKEIERKGIAFTRESFLKQIQNGNKDIVLLFLKAGMDVNAKGEHGDTALMLAIDASKSSSGGENYLGIIKQLIEKGADINARTSDGVTVLMATSDDPRSLNIAKLLIEKGADVNAKTFAGVTALFWAAQFDNYEMAKMLVENGADVNVKITDAPCASDAPNTSFWKGLTPLMSASTLGHINIVKLFIDNKADINATNEHGDTAMSLAIREKHVYIVNILKQAGAR
jgi:ankyrin repeat protein